MREFLYEKGQKIYPREVHGLFAALRTTAVCVLLGIFYGLPWLQYEGRQAVLLDLPGRKFHIFNLTFWPQDFIFLTGLLLLAALSLFFFTALAGRLWCGFACPQTVWTEIFLWMERLVEGDRRKQMKLDQSPLTFRKFRIKTTKHALWIAFAAFTGFTFVGYFTPISDLWHKIISFNTGPWETFWVFFYGFATYGNAGWMREQVCKYMCPYARFQGAMFDSDTLIVAYDPNRGEPRGPRRRDADPVELGLGDCINCQLCVQVCPTGIDIRDGQQYECITCSACIDACDSVMDKMGYPRGLIKYTTQNAIDGKPSRIIRPRIVIYGAILLALFGAIVIGIAMRKPFDYDIMRDRNSLYREVSNGVIENVYTLRFMNKGDQMHEYSIDVSGLPGIESMHDHQLIILDSGEIIEVPVRVRAKEDVLNSRSEYIEFHVLTSQHPDLTITKEARFLGPLQ
ncbi:MAG: cytochrome c oxidase accessory protein CcoG [Gammaproteobacteria bacterium]|nr:cytochrome c oxidase accessory protein CcoG [Gammaproteobacteria bacterium]